MASITQRVAAVMAFDAATLAVASALHLSGNVRGRADPYDASHAGTAEAIIGVVLVVGAIALWRMHERGRTIGLVANGFAIIGFLVGLNFTARGGHIPDIAYHLTLLPVLIATEIVLWRLGDRTPTTPRTTPDDLAGTAHGHRS
jgi:hypothetical protein